MTSIYSFNKATEEQIKDHLWRVDTDYKPPLHTYVDIAQYARKMATSAVRLEYFIGTNLISLMAGYYNPEKHFLYISNFSIEKEYRGKGMELVIELIKFLGKNQNQAIIRPEIKEIGLQFFEVLTKEMALGKPIIKTIQTEVRNDNHKLILFYKKLGFRDVKIENESTYLIIDL